MTTRPFKDLRDVRFIKRGFQYIDKFWRPWHRAEVSGVENVPKGPALYVGNHNGGMLSMDSLVVSAIRPTFQVEIGFDDCP